ncbi:MAG: CopG family transcriptional regulator [Propionibacteriaceae bacterium]|nr:CopG family transcriptional regulator [Propionibacteriaceae bacterium]
MSTDEKRQPMTPEQEHEFYAEPRNQEPQGPARRRKSPLSKPVPVRFPAELLEDVKRAAEADDRSVSAWIRRAVEHELSRSAN